MSERLDIVQLIERNPITRLNKEYEHKFIQKIKNNFTENQQQMFAASFYSYLNYNSKTDFIIDMDLVWKWLGFDRKGKCKELLVKHFTVDIDYKIELPQMGKRKNKGGFNKEQILLNIHTFKRLCLKSNAKKADDVHEYFIKLEEIFQEILNDESTELRIQLQDKNQEIQQIQNDRINDKKLEKHKILLEKFNNKDCVYLIEIVNKNKNTDIICEIKIGSTGDIKERFYKHSKNYSECIILDIFESDQFRKVEQNILHDPIIRANKANYSINGQISTEVVKISNSFNYKQLLKIIKDYIKNGLFFVSEHILQVKKLDNEKLKLESVKLKLEYIIKNNLEFTQALNFLKNLQDIQEFKQEIQEIQKSDVDNPDVDNPDVDNQDEEFKIIYQPPQGRRIQQIDPDNLQNIIKVYPSMIFLLREKEKLGFYKQNVQKAIKENTLYKEFRWKFLENGQNDSIVYDIQPTVNKKTNKSENIVKLNLEKTQILEIFTGVKDLSQKLIHPPKRVKKFVDLNETYNGYYYLRISQCPDNILKLYTRPIKKLTKGIIQINPLTKEKTVHESINNICVKLGSTISVLLECINTKTMHKGSFWKFQ